MLDFLKTRKQRITAEQNLKIYNSMLDVADVKFGYEYWRKVLLNKIIRMFKYTGLPETIPSTELEKILLLTGKAGLVPSVYGIVAVPAEPYGVGLYPTYYPYAVWATPLVRGQGTTSRDCAIIRNNCQLTSINDTISRYARMLADVESTLALTLVNVRQPAMAAAPDDSTAMSYQCANLALRLGQTEAVLNSSILDDIKTIPAINTIPTTLLNDIIAARDKLLNQFFAEFGIASKEPSKKAQMSVAEFESGTQVMTINTRDMLESRKESIELANSILGTNITVDIDEYYEPVQDPSPEETEDKGDDTNDDTSRPD